MQQHRILASRHPIDQFHISRASSANATAPIILPCKQTKWQQVQRKRRSHGQFLVSLVNQRQTRSCRYQFKNLTMPLLHRELRSNASQNNRNTQISPLKSVDKKGKKVSRSMVEGLFLARI